VSRWDRLLIFGGLNLAALVLFMICFALLPVIAFSSRKFAILYVCLLCFSPAQAYPLPIGATDLLAIQKSSPGAPGCQD
jgi:hypothetical protein